MIGRALCLVTLVMIGTSARAADRLQWAESHLNAGRLKQAESIYRRVLESAPKEVRALAGLTRTLIAKGDMAGAAEVADRLVDLAPKAVHRRLWFRAAQHLPERRERAVQRCLELVESFSDDAQLATDCARLLSWTEGKLDRAVALYREALARGPSSRAARLGLAQTLAWSGHGSEAVEHYEVLLERNPEDPEALLGRAQVARWSGSPFTAHSLASRVVELKPEDPRGWVELGHAELALGDPSAAEDAARRALDLDADHAEARALLADVERRTAPEIEAFGTAYSEAPTNLQRQSGGVRGRVNPWRNARLDLFASAARFAQGDDSLARIGVGLGAEQQLGLGTGLSGQYRLHIQPDEPTYSHSGGAALVRTAPFPLKIGARHRAMVDAPVDDSAIAPLEGTGSGGLPLASIRDELRLTEGHLDAAYSPFAGSYLYAGVAAGVVHRPSQNRRLQIAAGLGVDVIGLFTSQWPLRATVKYNYFYLGYGAELPDYFSPSDFQVHTPGAELRWDIADWGVIGAEGLVSLRVGAPVGGIFSAFGRLELGMFGLEARFQYVDDTTFRMLTGGGRALVRF